MQQEQLDGHETFLIELEEDYEPTEEKASLHEDSAMSSEIPLDNSSKSQDDDSSVPQKQQKPSLSETQSRQSTSRKDSDINNITVGDLGAKRSKLKAETPQPPIDGTAYLGYGS